MIEPPSPNPASRNAAAEPRAIASGAQPRHTLVSCLFDLEKREQTGRRPIDFYFAHGDLILGLQQPLVVYADPELVPWIRESRLDRGLGKLTRVVELPMEALALFPLAQTIAGYPTYANDNPLKGTPLHQIVQWSKFDLLERSMQDDPFDTRHFAWIDFGVGHVAEPPVVFPHTTSRVAFLEMCSTAPREVANKLEFLGLERGRIAGGFFRGPREPLRSLVAAFREELEETLAARFRPNEQMLLAWLAMKRPDLFEFYVGDYASVLTNWDHVRRDVETVFINITHCRANALWSRAYELCETLRASVSAGALELTAGQEARLLDERFIAAWYTGRHDVAASVRRDFLERLAGSSYFAENRRRILGNFALLAPGDSRAP